MGYDLEIEGRKGKDIYSIWAMECLCILRALFTEKISLEEAENLAITMKMARDAAMAPNEDPFGEPKSKKNKKKGKEPTMTIVVEKHKKGDIPDHVFYTSDNDQDGFVYSACFIPKTEEAAKQLKEQIENDGFEEKLLPHVKMSIAHVERMDNYKIIIDDPLFSIFASNGGHVFDALQMCSIAEPFVGKDFLGILLSRDTAKAMAWMSKRNLTEGSPLSYDPFQDKKELVDTLKEIVGENEIGQAMRLVGSLCYAVSRRSRIRMT